MPVTEYKSCSDFSDMMEAMNDTISMIIALNSMLEYTLRSGEDVRETGYGTYRLFQQQCDDLRSLCGAIRAEYHQLKQSKLEIKNPERIAECAGVSQYVVNRVISIATGIKLGPLTKQQADQSHRVSQQERASTQSDFHPHAFNEEFGHQVAPANMGD